MKVCPNNPKHKLHSVYVRNLINRKRKLIKVSYRCLICNQNFEFKELIK